MRLEKLALMAALGGCSSSYVLSEEEGTRAIREELAAAGIQAADASHVVGPVSLDGATISFALDGWSASAALGFEYVSEGDGDFAAMPSELDTSEGSERLQAAVDAALAATPGAVVLVFRAWGHETALLAEEQLRAEVRRRLDALGP